MFASRSTRRQLERLRSRSFQQVSVRFPPISTRRTCSSKNAAVFEAAPDFSRPPPPRAPVSPYQPYALLLVPNSRRVSCSRMRSRSTCRGS
jgi:hypothetical protein